MRIEPHFDRGRFDGRASIAVTVTEPTSQIVLNAIDLDIRKASLRNEDGEFPATVTVDAENERVGLGFDQSVQRGAATIAIDYQGQFNNQLVGFYQSRFTDTTGEPRVIATTQFEAADARRAFPGWDEPDLKAVFAVTLVVPEDLFTISNTSEVERRLLGNGKVEVRFGETMKMSTYLVAFVAGPLEATPPVDVDGVPLRIVYPRGKGHLTEFALDVGTFCLRWFADYYGIPYPGDKCDLIAVPDFAFGAMENLGAIIFREAALLVDPESATQVELSRIADVIAHELAHMWFGDLVTMKWWNGIWLNEAFASFMEMKCTDAFRPDWQRWVAFAAEPGGEKSDSMDVDALSATRPVEFEVTSPAEANEMFDSLTYGKGSACLRMLEQFLGEDVFKDGIRLYLRRHSHSNTETADLWTALEEVAHRPVGKIMDTFIHQGGYPAITLENGQVTQHRFTLLPSHDETRWSVPVLVRDRRETRRLLLSNGPVEISGNSEVVINAGGHGYYRVRYPLAHLQGLLDHVDQLGLLERYAILDDAWAFTRAGQLDANAYLRLAERYRDETEYYIWQLMLRTLDELTRIVEPAGLASLQEYVRRLAGPKTERLGWEPGLGESDLERRLRGSLLTALGTFAGDPAVRQRARELLRQVFEDAASLDPEVTRCVLMINAFSGSAGDYESYLQRYRFASTPQEERRFLLGLSDFSDPDLAMRTFDAALDGTIRSQDSALTIARLLANRHAGRAAWARLVKSWSEVIDKVPRTIVRFLLRGVPYLSEPDLASEVRSFFAAHTVPQGAKTLPQMLETLTVNVALREREGSRLAAAVASLRPT